MVRKHHDVLWWRVVIILYTLQSITSILEIPQYIHCTCTCTCMYEAMSWVICIAFLLWLWSPFLIGLWKLGVHRANQTNSRQLFWASWPSSVPCMPSCSVRAILQNYTLCLSLLLQHHDLDQTTRWGLNTWSHVLMTWERRGITWCS